MNAFASFKRGSPLSQGDAAVIDVGLMQLCGRYLAVPAASVREVVPLPERLHPDFSESGACAGTIVVRGRAIPVLDIAERLGFPLRAERTGVVLILLHEQRLVGLIMDMVSGIGRVTPDQVQRFHIAGHPRAPLITSCFTHGDTLVGLIDPAAVFALPGVAVADETGSDQRKGVRRQSSAVLVSVADANIAIDASHVVATVPSVQLKASVVPTSKWVGVVQYLDREVPVVDDLSLFGLSGRAAIGTGGGVILLKFDDHNMLGLKIDRVRRILPLGEQAVLPLSKTLRERLTLFAGTVMDEEGQQNLLVDHDKLRGCETLRMISALGLSPRKAESATVVKGLIPHSGTNQSFVVFRTGKGYRAALLASVRQIIPFPSNTTTIRSNGSALQGIASYNGAPLPLLDLTGAEAGFVSDRESCMVLVVEQAGAYNGLVVEKIETITRSVAQRSSDLLTEKQSFIHVRINNELKAVTIDDLDQAIERLTLFGDTSLTLPALPHLNCSRRR